LYFAQFTLPNTSPISLPFARKRGRSADGCRHRRQVANAATAVSFGRTFNEGASHGSYFLILHGNAAGKWV